MRETSPQFLRDSSASWICWLDVSYGDSNIMSGLDVCLLPPSCPEGISAPGCVEASEPRCRSLRSPLAFICNAGMTSKSTNA